MPVSCPISSKPIIIISFAKVLLTSGRDRKAIHAFPAISEYKLWILRHLFPKGPPVTRLHRDEHLGCSLACLVSFIFQCLQVPRQWRRRTQALCKRPHAQWLHQEPLLGLGLCCLGSAASHPPPRAVEMELLRATATLPGPGLGKGVVSISHLNCETSQ